VAEQDERNRHGTQTVERRDVTGVLTGANCCS